MSKMSKVTQAYFRELQKEGQKKRQQSAVENYDWAGMFAKLETQFAKGEEHVNLTFASNQQQKIVVKYLRSIGFLVHDDYWYECYVSIKRPFWKEVQLFFADDDIQEICTFGLLFVGVLVGFVCLPIGLVMIVLGIIAMVRYGVKH